MNISAKVIILFLISLNKQNFLFYLNEKLKITIKFLFIMLFFCAKTLKINVIQIKNIRFNLFIVIFSW